MTEKYTPSKVDKIVQTIKTPEQGAKALIAMISPGLRQKIEEFEKRQIERRSAKLREPKIVLTRELAQKIQEGFGGQADDEIPLSDLYHAFGLSTNYAKLHRQSTDFKHPEWSNLLDSLEPLERMAIGKIIGQLNNGGISDVGQLRRMEDERIINLRGVGIRGFRFIKTSFQQKYLNKNRGDEGKR